MAQRLQNAAARMITGNYDYINVRREDLVKQLKWQTIAERQRFHTALLMFKCVNGLAPNYLSDQITLLRDTNMYQTRETNGLNVYTPFPRKDIFKRSFLYNGATVWNSFPKFVQESDNIDDFKTNYKKHYFY